MIPKNYEYTSKVKIISGYSSIENIPFELKLYKCNRPIVITHIEDECHRAVKKLIDSIIESELTVGSFLFVENDTEESMKDYLKEFIDNNCDSIIALGDNTAFEVGKYIKEKFNERTKADVSLLDQTAEKKYNPLFIVVPIDNYGIKTVSEAEVVVLDPQMTTERSSLKTILSIVDIICHSFEAYTSLQKNPISDAYAFAALNLVRENSETAIKKSRDRKSRLALANAALLSGLAMQNSQPGIIQALAYGIEEVYRVSHGGVLAIIMPFCMDYNMIKLDQLYGELLLPLAGADIYSDTPHYERGRKAVQTIKNRLSEYKRKYAIPGSLSEIGATRASFEDIYKACHKDISLLYNAVTVKEEDVYNILSLAF